MGKNMKKLNIKNHIQLGITLLVLSLSLISFSANGRAKKTTNKTIDKSSQVDLKYRYYFDEALRLKLKGDLMSASDLLYRCYMLKPDAGSVYLELAIVSSKQQKSKQAVAFSKKAVELNPQNIRYRRSYADLLARNGQADESIATYLYLIKKDPDFASYYYSQLASLYTWKKDYIKACWAWDQYAKETELTSEITEEKFKLYLSANKKEAAFEQIDELINSNPEEFDYVAYKAMMYNGLGDSVSADKTFMDAYKKYPNNAMLDLVYAKYMKGLGEADKAKEYYRRSVENKSGAYEVRASALWQATSDSSIIDDDNLYHEFIKEYPDESLPYLCYGMALFFKEDTVGVDYLKKSLEIQPMQLDVWRTVVSYYGSVEQNDSLSAVCETALTYYPEEVDFHYTKGFMLASQRKSKDALEEWRTAIDLARKQNNGGAKNYEISRMYLIMGDYLYQQEQDMEKALAAYDSSLTYFPENVMALNNYSYYLSEANKDLDKAERMSLKTVKANPQNSTFLDTYAWICFKRGELSMASLYIEQAYNNGGKLRSEIVEHYGDILFKMGQKEEGRQRWKEALDLKLKEEEVERKKKDDGTTYINLYDSFLKCLNVLKKKVETGEYVE